MLQNAYFLAKIGADTAGNEQHFAKISQRSPRGRAGRSSGLQAGQAGPDALLEVEQLQGHPELPRVDGVAVPVLLRQREEDLGPENPEKFPRACTERRLSVDVSSSDASSRK